MVTSILSVVITFVVLVWIHEFGHYWAARAMGVRVEIFSLGMGRKIFGFRRGETYYQLAWFPLGGYVKLAGEENYERGRPPEKDEFFGQAPGRKAFILVMGSVHNFLLGFLIFVFIFALGIELTDFSRAKIGFVEDDFPAAAAGLQPGDTIKTVDGEAVEDWEALSSRIHGAAGRDVTLEVEREGSVFSLEITPRLETVTGPEGEVSVGLIGIGPSSQIEKYSLPGAFLRGGRETVRVSGLIFYYLFKLIRGEVSSRELAGPVGIAQMTGQFAHAGLVNFLYFFSLISVNLGIVNLAFVFLPIVDGWHILMVGIERVRGRRLSRKFLEASQTVGVVLLAMLFLLVTYNDLLRIFTR